jgi:hypothetical protein
VSCYGLFLESGTGVAFLLYSFKPFQMKKYLPYCILFIICAYCFFSLYHASKEINFEFNGTVQKVIYTSFSHNPIITVNNQQFDLEWIRWYDDGAKVEVGDSVAKQKGTQMMSLFKKKNK